MIFQNHFAVAIIGIGNDEILLEAVNKDELNLELYEIFTTNKIRFYTGYIAGFTQKWMNMGTHLGEVIHSLALAPGESRNISIIEWYRRQSSNRDEKTIVDEQLSSSLVHSRALNEVVKTTAMEHLAGNSSMEASTKTTGFGLTAGGAATSSSGSSLSADLSKVVGFPLKAASSMLSSIAGSIGVSGVYSNNQQVGTLQSESSGTREVLGETQQNIKESTLQNSSNIRSIYSTIVVTDEQSEKETIQTKNVTNYNHSHALTIQYYEVLQRYEVLLQLESWTPVVYLPFKPVKFNISIILKYWHLLSVPVMASFSDFFERYNNFLKGYTPTNTNFILTQTVKVTKIKVTASSNGAPYLYKENQSGGVFGSNQQITKSINKPADHFQVLINQPAIASLPYLTFPINEMILSTPQLNFSDLGGLYLQWGHFPEIPQNPQDENTIKVDLEFTLLDANGDVTVITKSYSRTLKIQEFFNAHFTPIALTNNINSDLQNSFNSTAQSTSVELKNEVEKHFNTYKYVYTRYLLSSIEGDQLSDIIESLHFNSPGTIFIENYIFPNPIAITENYLVFKHKKLPPIPSDIENPCNPTEFEGFNDPFWDAFLRLRCNVEEYKNNKSNKTVDTVFLPTAGVFAEAILGRSNASEFVDPRRFWNWQDSPIPFSAPQIAAIQAGNHTVTDSSGVLTPNVPASNLNIINPPQYALPTTLSSALQAVQNGNMFRDMSKSGELVSILGNLANLASTTATLAGNLSGEAAANALNGAVELGKQVAGMVNKASENWATESVASPPSTPTEKAAALNVLDGIQKNMTSGGKPIPTDVAKANVMGVDIESPKSDDLDESEASLTHIGSTSRKNDSRILILSANSLTNPTVITGRLISGKLYDNTSASITISINNCLQFLNHVEVVSNFYEVGKELFLSTNIKSEELRQLIVTTLVNSYPQLWNSFVTYSNLGEDFFVDISIDIASNTKTCTIGGNFISLPNDNIIDHSGNSVGPGRGSSFFYGSNNGTLALRMINNLGSQVIPAPATPATVSAGNIFRQSDTFRMLIFDSGNNLISASFRNRPTYQYPLNLGDTQLGLLPIFDVAGNVVFVNFPMGIFDDVISSYDPNEWVAGPPLPLPLTLMPLPVTPALVRATYITTNPIPPNAIYRIRFSRILVELTTFNATVATYIENIDFDNVVLQQGFMNLVQLNLSGGVYQLLLNGFPLPITPSSNIIYQ